jgi:nucleoid-associated protein YgaU
MSSTSTYYVTDARVSRPAAAGVRLTRRGKAVVLSLTLLAVFAVLALRGAPAASTDVVHHQSTATVIVTPGDTLWDIARRVDPGADPRQVIAQIEEMNSLPDDGLLHVGEPLFVPASHK